MPVRIAPPRLSASGGSAVRTPGCRAAGSGIALAVIALLLNACGGGDKAAVGKDDAVLSSCAEADTTAVMVAVREYITTASPTPQRYLSAAGTDSAVPEDGFKVLQDKGPTYFYGGDSTAQRKIREKLASVGPYASLLVLFKGKTETADGNDVTITLGGQYIGGEHEGKRAAAKTYGVRCDSTRWKVATTTVDSAR